MSRKPTQKKHARTVVRGRSQKGISVEELQSRWASLHVRGRTRKRLEHLLQEEGAFVALAATIALSLESDREPSHLTRSLISWCSEELRLLFLEESSAHMVESGRVMLDAIIAWHVFQLPAVLSSFSIPLIAFGGLVVYGIVVWGVHLSRLLRLYQTRWRGAMTTHP